MKPIILSRAGRTWVVHINGGSIMLTRNVRDRLGFKDLRPLVLTQAGQLSFGSPGDEPYKLKSKKDAEAMAHRIGRYMFNLGDFVSSYTEVM